MHYSDTPSVQINLDVVDKNIKEAVSSLAAFGIKHRPHIKVHKSVHLAKLQQQLGCVGVTCAKLGEAEAMADGGIDDILLAFPLIGTLKLARYRLLCERPGLTIRTVINSVEGASGLSKLGQSMGKKLEVLIELDGGMNRGGVKQGPPLQAFAKAIKNLEGIQVVGIEYYGGDIYNSHNLEEARLRAKKERNDILEAAEDLSSLGFSMDILSGGSSFSLRFPEELEGLTEVRAGNYIFNDGAQLSVKIVQEEDCALHICATVVARPDAYTAIIDAGSKTLTSDGVHAWKSLGYVVGNEDISIVKVNEEHGYLHSERKIDLQIGQIISIIPNHACVISNLCDSIYGIREGVLESVIAIEARGKNR